MDGKTPELPKIDGPGPIAVTNEELLQFVRRAGVYNHASADALVTIVRHFLNEAHQAGREDAARSTCQENADPERFGAFVNSHMHECKREVGHHSKVHHCACGCEWWGTTLEGIDLGRSSRGVGDNTEEQQR